MTTSTKIDFTAMTPEQAKDWTMGLVAPAKVHQAHVTVMVSGPKTGTVVVRDAYTIKDALKADGFTFRASDATWIKPYEEGRFLQVLISMIAAVHPVANGTAPAILLNAMTDGKVSQAFDTRALAVIRKEIGL